MADDDVDRCPAGETLIGGGGTLGLLTVAAILFIALLPYYAFREISRQLGPGALNKLLFGSPTNRGA